MTRGLVAVIDATGNTGLNAGNGTNVVVEVGVLVGAVVNVGVGLVGVILGVFVALNVEVGVKVLEDPGVFVNELLGVAVSVEVEVLSEVAVGVLARHSVTKTNIVQISIKIIKLAHKNKHLVILILEPVIGWGKREFIFELYQSHL